MQEDSDWFSFLHCGIWCNAQRASLGLWRLGEGWSICMISQHEVAAGKRTCTDCSPSRRERDESLGLGYFVPWREKLKWAWDCEWMKCGMQIKHRRTWICRGTLLIHICIPQRLRLQRNRNPHRMRHWNGENKLWRVLTSYSISKYLEWLKFFFSSSNPGYLLRKCN